MESGRKKYLKNFIVLIDNTLMNAIMRLQIRLQKYCKKSLQNMYMVLQPHQNGRMDWKRSIICCLARSDTVILQKKK